MVHERLVGLGFVGDERTTRRAVAAVKQAYRDGHRRQYRPWITEPGLWLQFDWGAGPVVFGIRWPAAADVVVLRLAGLVAVPGGAPDLGPQAGHLVDVPGHLLRRLGGAPTYALTDNEKTVTVEHVAGVPVRHPMIVAAGRHYGLTVHTCIPFDPESKGGSEATVRIAKADLVPTKANLLTGYNCFAELAEACEAFCEKVNDRVHRETNRIPAEALLVEQARLHPIPAAPFTAALGETRTVNADQTIRFGSVRYSTPPGLVGREVWVRADGDELVVTANLPTQGSARWRGIGCRRRGTRASTWPTTRTTPSSRTGRRSRRSQGPQHRGEGVPGARARCHSWLVEAAAVGAQRVRSKMTAALELAALVGAGPVDAALGVAAAAGRFAEADLLAIVQHRANGASIASLVVADEDHSAQPGTSAWASFGTQPDTKTTGEEF